MARFFHKISFCLCLCYTEIECSPIEASDEMLWYTIFQFINNSLYSNNILCLNLLNLTQITIIIYSVSLFLEYFIPYRVLAHGNIPTLFLISIISHNIY